MLRHLLGHKGTRSSGSVSVETLFVAPLLFLLMAGAYEVSRAIYNYQIALSAAYEGARAMSQMDWRVLPSGCFDNSTMQYAAGGTDPNIRPVMDRVNYLLALQGSQFSLDNRDIQAEIVLRNDTAQSSSCYSADRVSTVAVRITGTYHPALFSFLSFPLSVDSWAYQLSNNLAFSSTVNPNPGGSCGGMSDSTNGGAGDKPESAEGGLGVESVGKGGEVGVLMSPVVIDPKDGGGQQAAVVIDPCSSV